MRPSSAQARDRALGTHAALLFVQLTFGSWAVVGKYVLSALSPLELAGVRVAGAIPIFLTLAALAGGGLPARRDLGRLVALGISGVFLNQLLYVFGLQRTTATNAAILQTAVPVFTAAIAALLGVESLRPAKVIGVGLAVAGALVMLDLSRLRLGGASVLGDLMIIGNSLSYATYLVLQRPLLARLPPIAVTGWAYVFGGLPILLVSAPALGSADLGAVPSVTWWALVYIVLVPTTLNYVLISAAVKKTSPALVATYATLQPLAASLMAAIFLGERAGWRQVLGFVLIVLGLVAVTRAAARGERSTS